ncbi:tyrosine-type recombinase/integrase [Bryobacter aggregatus]|nr:tyrosine-type recombinase/integrase [Bryobacter aggregatus]
MDYLTELVSMYVKAAQIKKQGSCHMLRHTMATLMLEGGADTRFIQAMLI